MNEDTECFCLPIGAEAYEDTLPKVCRPTQKEHLKGLKQSQHCGRLPPETTDALCIQEAYLVTRNLFPQDLHPYQLCSAFLNQSMSPVPLGQFISLMPYSLHHARTNPPPPPAPA